MHAAVRRECGEIHECPELEMFSQDNVRGEWTVSLKKRKKEVKDKRKNMEQKKEKRKIVKG